MREWIKHQGASAVIPLLPNGNYHHGSSISLSNRQSNFRNSSRQLDSIDEDPLVCAKRELSEETGYSAEKYTLLHKLATTVGFSNEWIYI